MLEIGAQLLTEFIISYDSFSKLCLIPSHQFPSHPSTARTDTTPRHWNPLDRKSSLSFPSSPLLSFSYITVSVLSTISVRLSSAKHCTVSCVERNVQRTLGVHAPTAPRPEVIEIEDLEDQSSSGGSSTGMQTQRRRPGNPSDLSQVSKRKKTVRGARIAARLIMFSSRPLKLEDVI